MVSMSGLCRINAIPIKSSSMSTAILAGLSLPLPVLEFICRLTQHVPEKQFKMIRYYGIYTRHRKSDQRLRRAISKEKHHLFLSFNCWRESILHSFGYDPLKYQCCGTTMLFLELYFNHKPASLHELYEKTMRSYRCRSPASVLPYPAFS